MYELILSDKPEVHEKEFNRLKKYLKRFDKKSEWVESVKNLFV